MAARKCQLCKEPSTWHITVGDEGELHLCPSCMIDVDQEIVAVKGRPSTTPS